MEVSINKIDVLPPSLAQIRELVCLIPFATLVVDDKGVIVLANQLADQLFGANPDELNGQPINRLMPERFRDRHEQHQASYMADPVTRPIDEKRELIALCWDGREFPAEIALSPLDTQDGVLILAMIRDITERKRVEKKLIRSRQQLRELSERLITVSDQERALLSRTIHDELGQAMTGLKMDLAWLQKRLGPDQQPLVEKTRAMSRVVDDFVQAIRQIATDLRPGILDDFGLEAAVEWQLEEFQQRSDIKCIFDSDMKACVPEKSASTAAFNILNEALTNIARHAQASQVEVVLSGNAAELTLVVRDNGRGISAHEINQRRSIGLLGMRERARMHGGTLKIEGSAGKGSSVTLRLPLTAEKEKQDD